MWTQYSERYQTVTRIIASDARKSGTRRPVGGAWFSGCAIVSSCSSHFCVRNHSNSLLPSFSTGTALSTCPSFASFFLVSISVIRSGVPKLSRLSVLSILPVLPELSVWPITASSTFPSLSSSPSPPSRLSIVQLPYLTGLSRLARLATYSFSGTTCPPWATVPSFSADFRHFSSLFHSQ
ncbi:hypothetical protein B0H19DRAFT_1265325 [Mycena capillaripes]|nr:hypothetical protein B0H19DRAFT_1265325 [Mycena capillaripes]